MSSNASLDPGEGPLSGDGLEAGIPKGGALSSVLVVDDEPGMRRFLKKALEKRFGLVEVSEDAAAAEALRSRCHFDLIIADIRLPGKSGVDWVRDIREQGSGTAVIFMTAHADLDAAIAALRVGAVDFILKPFRTEQILAAAASCLERQQMQRENFLLRREVDQRFDRSGIVGGCEQIRNLCQVIKRVAPMRSTVLIEGESGTGKELVARAIHRWSGRKGGFVPINCGAFSAELLESEFFGHAKGSFTGAHQSREGLFTYANGGTLFLDEIGEMPLAMQAHLLRVLEERTIRPVGSNQQLPVDVRILAATNRDLSQEVAGGRFREDLFYRLNVLTMRIPALRERREDIPDLVGHFVHTLSAEMGIEPPAIRTEDLVRLMDYRWPGNVRELRDVIERCLLLNAAPAQCIAGPHMGGEADEEAGDEVRLDAVERRHILRVLSLEAGNKSSTARRLGIARKTLERKLKEWGEF